MRIRDWSSYVCSSDLTARETEDLPALPKMRKYRSISVGYPVALDCRKQHQRLVKVGIEQASNNGIEPPAMDIGARCKDGYRQWLASRLQAPYEFQIGRAHV